MATIVVGDALLCISTGKNVVNFSRRFSRSADLKSFNLIICGKKNIANIMIEHNKISDSDLRIQIKNAEICFGGNRKLKIYGTLKCPSGKRMKRENRVFFLSENEARQNGFRPCGHCMKTEYQNWKNGLI